MSQETSRETEISGHRGASADLDARVHVEKLNPADEARYFQACADLHASLITGGFLTKLGRGFLTEFYRAIAASPDSFLLIAKGDSGIDGLIAGSTNSKSLMKNVILQRGWRFLPHIAKTVFRIEFVKKIWEVVRYPAKEEFADLPDAEIINFCIASDRQGIGIGQALFHALLDEFRARGIDQIRIVTGAGQESAQRFYDSAGAVRASCVTIHDDAASVVYTFQLG